MARMVTQGSDQSVTPTTCSSAARPAPVDYNGIVYTCKVSGFVDGRLSPVVDPNSDDGHS